MQPREWAAALEDRREQRAGEGERFTGYGLLGVRFASGEVLAFHRYTASSIGPPFTSIWQRSESGRWTVHTNVEPRRSFPRYFGPVLQDALMDDISVAWLGPREVSVTARHARIQLALRLKPSAATRLLTIAAGLLPRPAWRIPVIADALVSGAARLLRADGLVLGGRAPAGQYFRVRPRAVWLLEGAAAVINGRDPGPVAALPDEVRVGDHVIPGRGLFVSGDVAFQGCPVLPLHPSRDELLRQVVRGERAAM
ncbi:MAG TPA: hypothetical protein VK936_01070 [Longimicrobiales bacterium]|nr:hypothetical protein [Longimicrobiales bacterium]